MNDSAPAKELTDWESEVLDTPHSHGTDHVFTLRTHEIIVERSGKLYKLFTTVDAIILILVTVLLLAIIVAVVLFSLVMLNNLQMLDVIRTQAVPGSIS
jgi:hypothetical protein